jgi:uncharacterized protein with HEPN domain
VSRGDGLRLEDILEAIARVREYAPPLTDEALAGAVRDAILYNLVVIGEAAARLSDEVRASAPEIPWPQVVGLRNLLAHEYFRVDAEIIGEILDKQLSQLETTVEALLADFR